MAVEQLLMSTTGRRGRDAAGTTLLELLVSCGIFTFLALAAMAILSIGSGGFKVVQSKSDVSGMLNKFEADITTELRRASISSLGIYTQPTDYRWAVWFKTAMNDPAFVSTSGNPTAPLGDPIMEIINPSTGSAIMQRYVLYYVQQLDAETHAATYGYVCSSIGNPAGPDTTCPHKWLIKKEIYLYQNQTSGADSIGPQGASSTLTNLNTLMTDSPLNMATLTAETDSGGNSTSNIHRVQVLADNVLSFEVTRLAPNPDQPFQPPTTVSASGQEILFDLKVFKSLNASNIAVGTGPVVTVHPSPVPSVSPGFQMVGVQTTTDNQGTVTVHTADTWLSSGSAISSYTVQLDNRVIPENP